MGYEQNRAAEYGITEEEWGLGQPASEYVRSLAAAGSALGLLATAQVEQEPSVDLSNYFDELCGKAQMPFTD